LGFVPLIPIAIILSAIAAIGYWVSDGLKYLDKVGRVESLTREGYSPSEAYSLVHGSRFSITENLPWILGTVAALVFLPPIIRKLKRQ
jgi:hypothetical protein